ncbi:MAG: NUDIX hydrolase [Butyrivibrio sp.]|nr:NUDIX hydrolase [Butyrivibrio sp.]
MKFEGIEKVSTGKFITRYDLHYKTVDNKDKIYEMISRNSDIKTIQDINNPKPDAVVLIIEDETHEHILINKEFRMAAGCWVYNFPAGLIDPGETPEIAAKRELQEETGLEMISIDDFIGESYSAIGFSNEKNVCVVGTARGTFKESTSTFEEIEPGWYSKAEVKELLKNNPFAARTQAYCYMWSRS